jgi:hypothetical protein
MAARTWGRGSAVNRQLVYTPARGVERGQPKARELCALDAAVPDKRGKYRLKNALALCPMDLCPLPHRSRSRDWWRFGWAHGFIGTGLLCCTATVTVKAYRDAIQFGWRAGQYAREQLDAGHSSA